jgi:multiple sugar transport system ATP-binding protein
MAELTLKNITKVYDNQVKAVDDFNLEIADKEFIVLVGPSGCGKSTVLRMVAGLEEITEGELLIDGVRMNEVEPKDRDLSMVFQNYALFPHMTVYENIAFGLRRRKVPKHEIDRIVNETAEILEITELLKRKPKQLSGGQRQRVAIGRAIVRHPKAFLMDEPLSNLDAKLRNQMRAEIVKLRKRVNTTFIYVTHDQIEAMTLGDRIVVMNQGVIQQVGTPQEVFDRPENMFVAGFIGTPQMNFIDVSVEDHDGRVCAKLLDYYIELPHFAAFDGGAGEGRKAVLGIRPEYITVGENGVGIPAVVTMKELTGSSVQLHLKLGEGEIIVVVPSTMAAGIPEADEDDDGSSTVYITLEKDKIQLFLRRRKVPKHEIDRIVNETAEILEITELLKRKPKQLSGGQRQRVAIGRAIVRHPKAFLMDEPLSNLDAKLRNQMRAEIVKLRKRVNTTFIYVTHDQIEAMTLGDRIVVMNQGVIQQVGTPQEVFDRPENMFVAGFIGTPQMNFIDVSVEDHDGRVCAKLLDYYIELPHFAAFDGGAGEGRKAVLGIRPEYITVGENGVGIPAVVTMKELTGSSVQLHLKLGEGEIIVVVPSTMAAGIPEADEDDDGSSTVYITLEKDKIQLFDPETQTTIK